MKFYGGETSRRNNFTSMKIGSECRNFPSSKIGLSVGVTSRVSEWRSHHFCVGLPLVTHSVIQYNIDYVIYPESPTPF